MATAEGKLNISELDFTKIKDNLVGFMSNQSEFVGYNFKDLLLMFFLMFWHITHITMHIMRT